MTHPPPHDYDRQQAELVARIRDHRAKLVARAAPPPPITELPTEERRLVWALSVVMAALIGVALIAEGVAIVYSRTVVVDDGGGRVP